MRVRATCSAVFAVAAVLVLPVPVRAEPDFTDNGASKLYDELRFSKDSPMGLVVIGYGPPPELGIPSFHWRRFDPQTLAIGDTVPGLSPDEGWRLGLRNWAELLTHPVHALRPGPDSDPRLRPDNQGFRYKIKLLPPGDYFIDAVEFDYGARGLLDGPVRALHVTAGKAVFIGGAIFTEMGRAGSETWSMAWAQVDLLPSAQAFLARYPNLAVDSLDASVKYLELVCKRKRKTFFSPEGSSCDAALSSLRIPAGTTISSRPRE